MLIQLTTAELEGMMVRAGQKALELYRGKPEVKLLSVKEACERLNIGKTKLYELMEAGELEKKKIGAKTMITTRSIDHYLNK